MWRYNHYKSCIPYGVKRQILLATLKKIERSASDKEMLLESARAGIKEFVELGYPVGIIRFMCAIVARDSANPVWLDIRDSLREKE